ncbi:MAG: DMT family transporter [Bacteroidetes bacterium]|nr:MAG: DMT family transporter [Bacteroidota bacterium]
MSPYWIAFFASFAMQICFGITNTLWKKPVAVITPALVILYRNSFTTLFLGFATYFFSPPLACSWSDIMQAIFISMVSFYGLFFFNYANRFGEITRVVPIINLNGFVMPFLIGVFYFQETISITKVGILLMSFVGIFLLQKWEINKKNSLDKGIVFALLAMFFWGISYPFFALPVRKMGSTFFGFVLEGTILCMSFIHFLPTLVREGRQAFLPTGLSKVFKTIVVIAVLGSLGVYFTNVSLYHLDITFLIILGAFGHILPIAIAHFVHQEKLNLRTYIGVILLIISVLTTNFLQK